MKPYKICVYAIARDEAALVQRYMDTASEADCAVVLDLGSTDGTVDILRARGAEVYQQLVEPFRYDEARNRALELVPEDADLCVSADLDEVLSPGWRARLEGAWHCLYTRASCAFVPRPAQGDVSEASYPVERIHRRHGFRWAHPVHEVLVYEGTDPDLSAHIEGMAIRYFPMGEKSRAEYLSLLELSAAENPEDGRAAFFLGRAYFQEREYDKCVAELIRHLGLPAATWDEERSAAVGYIALSLSALGYRDAARAWLYKAIGECVRAREPYYRMAVYGYQMEDWELTHFMVDRALQISNPTGSYLAEMDAWGGTLYDIGAVAAYHMGLYDNALAYAQRALEFAPGDERLEDNVALIAAMAKEGAREQV